MRKLKLFLALIVIVLVMTKDCSIVQAAEHNITVTSEGVTVRQLSQAEIAELSSGLTAGTIDGDRVEPMATAASYTAYEYSESFNFSLGDRWVACANAVCFVWHYTDGKVHLYSRTITVERLASMDADRFYGRIVNTDGSLSYTTGDRVRIIDYMDYWDFAIDFRVTPTEASFDCYEV